MASLILIVSIILPFIIIIRVSVTKCIFQLPKQTGETKTDIPGNNKHLLTGPDGNSEFCFPRISMFPETKSRETLRFEGNKIHCSPRDQSLSDLLYSKANKSNRLKTNNRVFDKWRATAVNISRVTVNCFPFDVIVFAMLPAHGIWRETVSLLDVMWQWTGQWMGAL